MGLILYYSNYCNNSKNLLSLIIKNNIQNDIHFICIDKRINKNNTTYVILENGQELLLPHNITAVPALMLIKENYKILLGNEIIQYLNFNNKNNIPSIEKNDNYSPEPTAFSLNDCNIGIHSDNFSFLDQDHNSLSAKGDGGMRQLYNYATINHYDKINTPTEDYVPDKINDDAIKSYEDNRNNLQK